jgi:hypothetical protein
MSDWDVSMHSSFCILFSVSGSKGGKGRFTNHPDLCCAGLSTAAMMVVLSCKCLVISSVLLGSVLLTQPILVTYSVSFPIKKTIVMVILRQQRHWKVLRPEIPMTIILLVWRRTRAITTSGCPMGFDSFVFCGLCFCESLSLDLLLGFGVFRSIGLLLLRLGVSLSFDLLLLRFGSLLSFGLLLPHFGVSLSFDLLLRFGLLGICSSDNTSIAMTQKNYMLPSYGHNHVLESAAEQWMILTSKNDKTFAIETTVDDSLSFVGVSQSSSTNIAMISASSVPNGRSEKKSSWLCSVHELFTNQPARTH